jgi:hypothetical protein
LNLTNVTATWAARATMTSTNYYGANSTWTTNSTHKIAIDLDSGETGTALTNWVYVVSLISGGNTYPIGTGRYDVVASTFTGAGTLLTSTNTWATKVWVQAQGYLTTAGSGDITAVTAGTGLSGGGTNGAVTVALSAGSIASLARADAALTNATASIVTCTGTYSTVQAALDALLYVAPSITALTGGNTYIKGQTIADPAIVWTVNKTMTTRAISGVATATLGAGGSGTYTDTGRNLATSGTYTLTVGDGTGTDSEGETFTFTNRRYVGASATTNQSNAEIIAMTASTQAKGASGTTGALSSEYIVIAYPASLGACTAFSLGGFSTTAWPSVSKAVTNSYGYAESYYVYRSENAQTTGGIAYDIH